MKDTTKTDSKALLLGELLRRGVKPQMEAEAERRKNPRTLGLEPDDE
ncbi:hypothetical protein ACIBQX_18660 [Nonomuraea sp. NPDC049714]